MMRRLFCSFDDGAFRGACPRGVGDDGLHKSPWMRDTFKDLSEDLEEANAEGKRLMVIIEQRGCIYCEKMHTEVFPNPTIADYIDEHFLCRAAQHVWRRRGHRL